MRGMARKGAKLVRYLSDEQTLEVKANTLEGVLRELAKCMHCAAGQVWLVAGACRAAAPP